MVGQKRRTFMVKSSTLEDEVKKQSELLWLLIKANAELLPDHNTNCRRYAAYGRTYPCNCKIAKFKEELQELVAAHEAI